MMKRLLSLLIVLTLCISVWAETYVVCVGIANYKNISDLNLCEKDAIAMANVYQKHTKHVITMTGRYATKDNIVKALTDQFARAKKDDMVVFFFSGHGYEKGFCPYDMTANMKSGLSYDDIYAIFRKSKATCKIILADACMSGGLRKNTKTPTHHAKRSDVLLFLSSRTKEYSIENRLMDNGIFTTYLERGLRGGADENKDRVITAKEIFEFVKSGVKQISNDKQHPVMWGNFDDNLVVMDWRK